MDGPIGLTIASGDRPGAAAGASSAERQRLGRLAAEFESMLMVQVLRDMRRAGQWEEDAAADTLGAESLFEMLDAELAAQMSKVQGFGMAKQLLEAFDRQQPSGASTAADAAAMPGTDVTSPFGWRADPLTGGARFHRGVDLKAAYGQDVPAADAGRVVFSGTQGGYGTTVVLEHANGSRTRYAHLSAALVAAGDAVGPGQVVGRAGSSGRATGPHLHFELLDAAGRPVDPMDHGF